jgi:hypothetical protein
VSASVNWPSREKRKLFREGAVLLSVLVILMVLAIRPFGFKAFVNGLVHDNVFSLLLVVSVIAVVLTDAKNRLDLLKRSQKTRVCVI